MDQLTPAELARLTDYFAQELDPDEMVRTERWIAERADRSRFVDDLRRSKISLQTDATNVTWDIDGRAREVRQRLATLWGQESVDESRTYRSIPSESQHQPQWVSRVKLGFATFAASALALAAGLYLGTGSPTGAALNSGMLSYVTGNGERARVMLPDGSTVLMNVASNLQLPANYSEKNRKIFLAGEALFTVIPQPGAPFTVTSEYSTTKVLGTSFSVRQYDSDTTAVVAVRDGKVSVGANTLTASQVVIISQNGTATLKTATAANFDFEQGTLTLSERKFAEAIPELNRWFNVEIRVADPSINAKSILGEFEAGAVSDLADVLRFTLDVRVERNGRILTLYDQRK